MMRAYLVHALGSTQIQQRINFLCFSASLLLDFPNFSASLLLWFSASKIKKILNMPISPAVAVVHVGA